MFMMIMEIIALSIMMIMTIQWDLVYELDDCGHHDDNHDDYDDALI